MPWRTNARAKDMPPPGATAAQWNALVYKELTGQTLPTPWTKEKPTKPGYYWIWTTRLYEDKPELFCVDVEIISGRISFYMPVSGMDWEDELEVDRTTHWLGPLPEPPPPIDR